MRIFFVGIHYKPGKTALDPSTKTGKLISRIEALLSLKITRTNLFSTTYLPQKLERLHLAEEWHRFYNPKNNDLIVLLGNTVQKEFFPCGYNILHLRHPASIWSRVSMINYVALSASKIQNFTP